MDTALITGGAGTIGSAFIAAYPDDYQYFVMSRSEKAQVELKQRFPFVTCLLGDVADAAQVQHCYDIAKPAVVIHSAALKHINLAEQQPIQACQVNLVGSLNIVRASLLNGTRFTLGVSTDKACDHQSVYGATKWLMEKCFTEASSTRTKFAICRLVNVAHSNGSVIPFWLKAKKRGEKLKVTDPEMRRLMISPLQAAQCLRSALTRMAWHLGGFVMVPLAKQVRIGDLATAISPNVEVVGKRPGEKLNEVLIDSEEISHTSLLHGNEDALDMALIDGQPGNLDALKGYDSATAAEMTFEEIQLLIAGHGCSPSS